jgi:hypothetical protein
MFWGNNSHSNTWRNALFINETFSSVVLPSIDDSALSGLESNIPLL